jgi:hypothetical protein
MISLLRQTLTGKSPRFELTRENILIGSAQVTSSPMSPCITVQSEAFPCFSMVPNLAGSFEKHLGKKLFQTAPWIILDNDKKQVGSVSRIREGFFLSSVYFIQLEFYGHLLKIYEVGLGKEGMRYPIYDGQGLIAQIEKDAIVHNDLDQYTICALESFGETAAFLGALYIDFTTFRNAGEYGKGKKSFQYVYTRKKEILAAYDPTFHSRCENQDM